MGKEGQLGEDVYAGEMRCLGDSPVVSPVWLCLHRCTVQYSTVITVFSARFMSYTQHGKERSRSQVGAVRERERETERDST